MKNYGLDLEREEAEVSKEDYVHLGGLSPYCLALIPPEERTDYLPQGEVQRGAEDTMDCASRSPVNILEMKFTYMLKKGLLTPANEQFLRNNGYVTENGVEFSDAFVAINSNTTKTGNSLKGPLEAIRKKGMVPKNMLRLETWMTWDDYHDPDRIDKSLQALGIQFKNRFTINYEKVFRENFAEILKGDLLNVAGYAWPEMNRNGIYGVVDYRPNHAFMAYKTPDFQIFDNYIDLYDGNFTKHLAYNYIFLKYGYRVYITNQTTNENNPNWLMDILSNLWQFLTSLGKQRILAT